ncbi:MAG TPA: hypothetical protein PLH27_08275 [bacterium]|nr:hypothetical protein [bacterium]HMZ05191.1 hypothetical protein [bacterium]HNB09021.1 hypothetical protein [bacterium]HNB57147.1 hypothetical protein [bacterium]HNC48966.1 hypothetical protein [bacterium]
MKKLTYIFLTGVFYLLGCGGGRDSADPIQKGWSAFESGEFYESRDIFLNIYLDNPNDAEAAHGLSWSLLRMDSVSRAVTMFESSEGALPPEDVTGGYTFALSAKKMYNESNTQADILINASPTWTFTHGSEINVIDIYIVKSANYFALGNYPASLNSIKMVNASFSADVTTASGRSSLAAEIERLRGLNKVNISE